MHLPGPYFSVRSKEAADCGRFGALGTNTHSKMAPGGHGCFSPVFHLLCKVSSDYRWIKQKELYYLSFKTVLEVLVVMFYSAFGKILTLTLEAHVLNIAYQVYAQLFCPFREFSTI